MACPILPDGGLVGGVKDIEANNEALQAAIQFALVEISNMGNAGALEVADTLHATQQLVAGVLYSASLRVRNLSGETRVLNVKVLSQPWLEPAYQLLSWDFASEDNGDPCAAMNCPEDTRCAVSNRLCMDNANPCPAAECVPVIDHSCKDAKCPASMPHCDDGHYLRTVKATGLNGDCCDVLECVATEADPCATMECPEGTICAVQNVECFAAPCPVVAECAKPVDDGDGSCDGFACMQGFPSCKSGERLLSTPPTLRNQDCCTHHECVQDCRTTALCAQAMPNCEKGQVLTTIPATGLDNFCCDKYECVADDLIGGQIDADLDSELVQGAVNFAIKELVAATNAGELQFKTLLKAKSQVVAGVKLQLIFQVSNIANELHTFEVEVLVQAWMQPSHKLLSWKSLDMVPLAGQACVVNGVEHADGEQFMDSCNTCTCKNGIPACTKIACPPADPCADMNCPEDTVCMPSNRLCIREPCPQAECVKKVSDEDKECPKDFACAVRPPTCGDDEELLIEAASGVNGFCCDKYTCVAKDSCKGTRCLLGMPHCGDDQVLKTTEPSMTNGDCCPKYECVARDSCETAKCILGMPHCGEDQELKTTEPSMTNGDCCPKYECVAKDPCPKDFVCAVRPPVCKDYEKMVTISASPKNGVCCDTFECVLDDCRMTARCALSMPNCGEGQELQVNKATGKDGFCCDEYKCVPAASDCSKVLCMMKEPDCADNQRLVKNEPTGVAGSCCETYDCVDRTPCSSNRICLDVNKVCEAGTHLVERKPTMLDDDCCPTFECVQDDAEPSDPCKGFACAMRPTCDENFRLVTHVATRTTGDCCDRYSCLPVPSDLDPAETSCEHAKCENRAVPCPMGSKLIWKEATMKDGDCCPLPVCQPEMDTLVCATVECQQPACKENERLTLTAATGVNGDCCPHFSCIPTTNSAEQGDEESRKWSWAVLLSTVAAVVVVVVVIVAAVVIRKRRTTGGYVAANLDDVISPMEGRAVNRIHRCDTPSVEYGGDNDY